MGDLENAGTTLAMNENSKKLDNLTIAVWSFIVFQLILIVGMYWFFDHFNIVDYVVFKLKGVC